MEIVKTTIPFYWLRAGAGLLYFTGIVLCIWNVVMTIRNAPGKAEDVTVQVPRLAPDTEVGTHIDAALDKPTFRERGNALHALVERWPTVMIVMITVSLVIGGLCEIVPQLIQGAVTPKISSVKPYTPLELAGRDIYIREGCNTCHTQMIRTLRAETERYRGSEYPGGASYTRAGETIYDRPFLWGSKRTGPDLAREGGLRPHSWHWAHLEDPTSMAKGSTMPRYPWFFVNDTDYAVLPTKLSVLSGAPLYTPYTPDERENCVALAKAQARQIADKLQADLGAGTKVDPDKEVIAVIAYLQRLGTDFLKSGGK
jgi:cytochrome c oxidase cbb3-type subunit I/II